MTMVTLLTPCFVVYFMAVSVATAPSPWRPKGAAAFSTPPAPVFGSAVEDGTVSGMWVRRQQRSLCRVGVRPAASVGFPLRSNASQDDEDMSNSREAKAAENGTESLLGEQALQALEFWKNRRPSPTLPRTQVVGLLMAALQKNDDPTEDAGLETVFEFSSGMCRRAVGGTASSFIRDAQNSVFAAAIGCQSFELEPMNSVGDRLATQVVRVVASDGRQRRFLWTLELQRRPPDAGKWLIYGVLSSDVDGMLTMED